MENSRWKTSTVRKRGKKRSNQKVPAVKELEAEIAERSVACARKLLEGNQEAIYELREKLADLKEQKALLIKAAGYSDDYLELHYAVKTAGIPAGWMATSAIAFCGPR